MAYQARKAADFCEMVFDQLMDTFGVETRRYDHASREVFIAARGAGGERLLRSDEAKSDGVVRAVRYAPDFEVPMLLGPDTEFFVEAKYMAAPRFLPGARLYAGRELDVGRVGDIEKHALDTYRDTYTSSSRRTALFVICSYSKTPVLMEFVDRIDVLAEGAGERNARASGSGTSHSNIDLASMRSLEQFLADELGLLLKDNAGWARLWPLLQMALFHVQAPEVLRERHEGTISRVTAGIARSVGRPMGVVWQPTVASSRAG